MKNIKSRFNTGITLIEIIIVVAIISILAAVAVPSVISFVEYGKQTNRMNIARTIYLAAQNQLTKNNVEKNLKSTMTGLYYVYYEKDDNVFYTDILNDKKIKNNNVADKLIESGGNFPDTGNEDCVHYISKPKGYEPTDEKNELNGFYNLLNEIIIDKSILNEAILIEYNIKTGVVLSVFYGDAFINGQTEFEYKDINNNDRNNITGGRGMDNGYKYASQRKQGYYGVEASGKVQPVNFKDIANIYDGANKPLETGVNEEKINVLYAEFLIAKQYESDGITESGISAYTFEIVNAKSSNSIIEYTVDDLGRPEFPASFYAAINDSEMIYKDNSLGAIEVNQYGINVGGYYNRYIWVIDYIEGDILSEQPQSIGIKYKDGEDHLIEPQNVRAKATNSAGAGVTSLSLANTHFGGGLTGGRYEVKSARHLNNIRYKSDGKYRQTADIDMLLSNNEITNFAPIKGINGEGFSGEYYAMKNTNSQYRIINLNIDTTNFTTPLADVGLFADTSGSIKGVSLFAATIKAKDADNVGAITGTMSGGTIKQSNSYANITVSGKDANVGGLAGCISVGILDQSFNAGFFNAHEDTKTSKGFGSVRAECGNIGGLVGLNSGIIQNSFSGARVNIDDVEITSEPELFSFEPAFYDITSQSYLGGIAGDNNGTVKNTYATNYVGIYTNGTVSGGITGNNSGSLNNNFYIANGCSDESAIPKDELQGKLLNLFSAYKKGADYNPGENSYLKYPYPTLRNNDPFEDTSYTWGWEDIQHIETGDAQYFYYELYNDNSWGYSSNRFHPDTIEPTSSDKLVVNDGYGLEFSFNNNGYKLIIGEETFIITADNTGGNIDWTVTRAADSDELFEWLDVQEFNSDDDILCRLYIPNNMAEDLLDGKGSVNLSIYANADADIEEAEPLISLTYNPLFAPRSYGSIRSPRHIDNIDKMPNGNYTQQLNVDFSLYCKELTTGYIADSATKLMFKNAERAAAVSGVFTGFYDGNGKLIINLDINVPDIVEDVGLFAVNNGSITRVTILNPKIIGGNNVGAVAGRNLNSVTYCSVQQTVTVVEELNIDLHPTTVTGISNVGGTIGYNSGTLTDIAFVSTSGKPAVKGTENFGGIVGNSIGGTIDNFMYLAVAPMTGTTLYPFTGNGAVTDNKINGKYYLSGTKALRPYQTYLNAVVTTDYNYLSTVPDEAKNTLGIVNEALFTGWNKNTLSDTDVINQKNDVYPYPYPNGTVVPGHSDWPITDDIVLGSADGIVYYEQYADGTYGVFTRRDDGAGGYIEVNYLNNNGIIVECGYAIMSTNVGLTAQRGAWASQDNGVSWKTLKQGKLGSGKTFTMPHFNEQYSVLNMSFLFEVAELVNNPAEPIIIWVASANGAQTGDKPNCDPLGLAYINPYFAKEVYPVSWTSNPYRITSALAQPVIHSIRTPWQMQNISRVTAKNYSEGHTFMQELNLNFNNPTSTEIINNNTATGSGTSVRPVITASTTNIVTGSFKGTYNGDNFSISNVTLQSGNGLFNNIDSGAVVKNLALLKSEITGSGNVGSVAGQNSGTIEHIEVSDITVAAKGTGNTGGIVGLNNKSGIVQNVYFNSTYKNSNGIYAASVSGGTNIGGLIGLNNGTLTNAYTTAVGPGNHPTIGAGNSAGDNVYFLQATGYNSNTGISPEQGTAKIPEDLEKINLGSDWEKATIQTTKNTVICTNFQYPFPKLKGINHYYDWPVITTTLKYYERYSDLSYGYYYPVNETTTVDSLKYNPDLTVIEEGYLIELAAIGTSNSYNIRFNDDTTNHTFTAVTVNGRRVIKLLHSEVESLITDARITANGITPVKIQASPAEKTSFTDELYVTDGFVYFNPLFAKAIYPQSGSDVPDADKNFEIRSPRHMLNIDRNTNSRNFYYRQTISLNFAREIIADRRYYSDVQTYADANINNSSVRTPIEEIGRNVVANLTGMYDGAYAGSFKGKTHSLTGRMGAYRIYNLIMNVPNNNTVANNTGSTFGNLAIGAKILNLEFVDPQIRYSGNGMGGGIVANVCYGVIENVNVYNENYTRSLFADVNGNTGTEFCASRLNITSLDYNSCGHNKQYTACAHAHGGIAGIVYGEKAMVTSCVVGTQSHDINEIFNNKTVINCHASTPEPLNELDTDFMHIGGVVGSVSAQARIVSCTNIATVEPLHWYTDRSSSSVGGISGFTGNVNAQTWKIGNEDAYQEINSKAYIIGCYNAGTIINHNSYVGGITGRSAGAAGVNGVNEFLTEIVSCYNTGRINVRENAQGILETVTPEGKDPGTNTRGCTPTRIGGISGETNGTAYYNCYNIGYVSDNVGGRTSDAAGAILGLPWDSKSIVENCFSLYTDKWAPATIVGPKYYSDGNINGIADPTTFDILFKDFWETRAKLRNNKELTSNIYINPSYPGLEFTSGGTKEYPVFGKDTASFYIYPQFIGSDLQGYPSNPHITPWEYTDAYYDATLKYYEKYGEDDPVGEYYLNKLGDTVNNLDKTDKPVTEDGYFIELGITGNYRVVIGDKSFDVEAVDNVFGIIGKTGIMISGEMRNACQPGYNKIAVYTMLPTDTGDGVINDQNEEDNTLNRLVGTTSTSTTSGIDLYFDYLFPKEIKRSTAALSTAVTHAVRSPRHIDNIGVLAVNTDKNLTAGITFTQETNIEFSVYNYDSYINIANGYDKTAEKFTRAIAQGTFEGIYDGNYKIISNINIAGSAESGNIGLFEINRGVIRNLQISKADYSSVSAAALNMGTIAAINNGTIAHAAVTGSKLTGAGGNSNIKQCIGGITGINGSTGKIKDVYFINEADTVPVFSNYTGINILGGLVGENAGNIDFALYIAKAPGFNPITYRNTGTIGDNVFYLAGDGYNEFDVGGNGGKPKTTVQFMVLCDNLDGWENWDKEEGCQYPNLTHIEPPADYPAAESSYRFAYYEQYNEDDFGWYYGESSPENNLDNNKDKHRYGYTIIVPWNSVEYVLRINGTVENLTLTVLDGKNVFILPDTVTDPTLIKVTLNNLEITNIFYYYPDNDESLTGDESEESGMDFPENPFETITLAGFPIYIVGKRKKVKKENSRYGAAK